MIIGVGSNISPEKNIAAAKQLLKQELRILSVSKFTRTKPIGPQKQRDFLNGSLLAETRFSDKRLKVFLKKVEKTLGRVENGNRYGPREIDLDILVWNGRVVDSDVYEREFLRDSVVELCPELEENLEIGEAFAGRTEIIEGLCLKKVLSKNDIEKAVFELAKKISNDYEGKTPVLICVLLGARRFFEDLAARITIPAEKRFLRVSSYRDKTRPGRLELLRDIECELSRRDVIIVEDLIDTSKTTEFLFRHIKSKNPASLRVCALVDKREKRSKGASVDYLGFRMNAGFLVGYGMDYMGRGRTLENIYSLEE